MTLNEFAQVYLHIRKVTWGIHQRHDRCASWASPATVHTLALFVSILGAMAVCPRHNRNIRVQLALDSLRDAADC